MDTNGDHDFLSVNVLGGNREPRRSFLPSHAPTAEALVSYLSQTAAEHAEQQQGQLRLQLTQQAQGEQRLMAIEPYTVGLSTLPLYSAERLLPDYLAPLVDELAAEAQTAERHAQTKNGTSPAAQTSAAAAAAPAARGSDRGTSVGGRLMGWLQSWTARFQATALGTSGTGESRERGRAAPTSDWLPPEAAFPCPVR